MPARPPPPWPLNWWHWTTYVSVGNVTTFDGYGHKDGPNAKDSFETISIRASTRTDAFNQCTKACSGWDEHWQCRFFTSFWPISEEADANETTSSSCYFYEDVTKVENLEECKQCASGLTQGKFCSFTECVWFAIWMYCIKCIIGPSSM